MLEIGSFVILFVYTTGAQEWHIVSLLGDVTSPTTAVDFVSMTSDLRLPSTEKHCPVRRQYTVCTNKWGGFVRSQQWMGVLKRFPSVSWFAHSWCTQTRVYSARGKCIVRHWRSREATLRHSSGWGTLSISPQYRDLRTCAQYWLINLV